MAEVDTAYAVVISGDNVYDVFALEEEAKAHADALKAEGESDSVEVRPVRYHGLPPVSLG